MPAQKFEDARFNSICGCAKCERMELVNGKLPAHLSARIRVHVRKMTTVALCGGMDGNR